MSSGGRHPFRHTPVRPCVNINPAEHITRKPDSWAGRLDHKPRPCRRFDYPHSKSDSWQVVTDRLIGVCLFSGLTGCQQVRAYIHARHHPRHHITHPPHTFFRHPFSACLGEECARGSFTGSTQHTKLCDSVNTQLIPADLVLYVYNLSPSIPHTNRHEATRRRT